MSEPCAAAFAYLICHLGNPGQVADSPAHHMSAAALKKQLQRRNVPTEGISDKHELATLLLHHTWTKEEHTVLIFDLGGGTLDTSIVTFEEGICAGMGSGIRTMGPYVHEW